MTGTLLLLLALASPVLAAEDPATQWKTEIESGRKAIAARNYSAAAESFRAALAHAEAVPGEAAGVVEALRACARGARLLDRFEDAEQFLSRAVSLSGEKFGDASPEIASALSELAGVQRAREKRAEALASLRKAVRIRQNLPDVKREDVAKDVTAVALLEVALNDVKAAKETLAQAIGAWEAAAGPDSVQLLPALDALGRIYRDAADYDQAEPLYSRSIEIREAAMGRDSSDLLAALDSMAYVYFGQKKLPQAEATYKRLLALWIASAGPDHPMVALTHDKLAEFYAFQQRYPEAEAESSQALTLRTAQHLASLQQTGRILLMEAKMKEAEDHYRRAVQIGDLGKAPDEAMDPVLRIYATVLRTANHPQEADAIDKRVKEALFRKGEREGRRPSPVKLPQ